MGLLGCTVGLMSKHNAVILHLSSEFTQVSASLTCLLSRVVLCICNREGRRNSVAISRSCQNDQFVGSSIDLLGSVASELLLKHSWCRTLHSHFK